MLKQNTDYALRARLAEPYEAAVEKVTAALKEAGGPPAPQFEGESIRLPQDWGAGGPPEQLLQKRKKKA